MDFYQSHRRLFRIHQVLGLTSFQYKSHKFIIPKYKRLMHLLPIIFYCIFFALQEVFYGELIGTIKFRSPTDIMNTIFMFYVHFATIITFLLNIEQNSKFVRFYNKMIRIDEKLQSNFGVALQFYERINAVVFWALFGYIGFIVLNFLYFVSFATTISEALVNVTIAFSYLLIAIDNCDYYCMLNVLAHHLWLIQEKIPVVLSADGSTKPNAVQQFKFIKLYFKMFKLIDCMSALYGRKILLQLNRDAYSLMTQWYTLFFSLLNNGATLRICTVVAFITFTHFVKVLVFSVKSHQVIQLIHSVGHDMQHHLERSQQYDLNDRYFQLKLHFRETKFMIADMFSIDHTTIFAVIVGVITYFLIFAQFEINEENQR